MDKPIFWVAGEGAIPPKSPPPLGETLHSKCRTEVAVKTAKRDITSNTGPNGRHNALQQAILQYRNTPDPQTGLLPAMCLFG